MTRVLKKIPIVHPEKFSQQLLEWAQNNETFLWLDSNEYPQKYTSFNKALALGVLSELETSYHNAFDNLDQYQQGVKDYIFGFLSYDLKNDIENLESTNFDGLAFPDLYFFQPKKLIFIKGNFVTFQYHTTYGSEIEADFKQIQAVVLSSNKKATSIAIIQRISEKKYLSKIDKIQKHIQRGDSYEVNFCMEYYAENTTIEPLSVYKALNDISQPPFACFFKRKSHLLLSASPERFVRKEKQKIISQPIKGTIARGDSKTTDKDLIKQLIQDPKERAENIMIVDLVRNDLSKTATKNSVEVEELCQVYTFKQVHQLVSTVVSNVKKTESPVKILQSLFPMGSMTGAPKITTMKIIEALEETKRGMYSGAVGYITPDDDFDFNVVIRSILYNAKKRYISFSVGGAITAKSKPKAEYKECQLKAAAMNKTLNPTI